MKVDNMDNEDLWKNHFFNYFFNPNPVIRNIGSQILSENKPDIICKYMNPFRSIDFIKNGYHLWASPMNKFTDKYDGRWYVINSYEENMTENKKMSLKVFMEYGDDNSITPIRKLMKICSFTTNPNDSHMWERFGVKSRGVCFEFINEPTHIIDECENPFRRIFPMKYESEKEDITDFLLSSTYDGWYNETTGTYFEHYYCILISLLKSEKYISENEWRAVWLDENENGHPIQTILPSKIYLGPRIKARVKRKILKNISTYCDYKIIQLINIKGKLYPVDITPKKQK